MKPDKKTAKNEDDPFIILGFNGDVEAVTDVSLIIENKGFDEDASTDIVKKITFTGLKPNYQEFIKNAHNNSALFQQSIANFSSIRKWGMCDTRISSNTNKAVMRFVQVYWYNPERDKGKKLIRVYAANYMRVESYTETTSSSKSSYKMTLVVDSQGELVIGTGDHEDKVVFSENEK